MKRLLSLSLLLLLSLVPARAAFAMDVDMVESCMAPPSPVVNVEIVEDAAQFDLTRSAQDLEAFKTEANAGHLPSSYHVQTQSDIRGVTVGNFSARYDVDYRYGDAIASDEVCVSIAAVNVRLTLMPVVYVAREFTDHACWFSEIFGHEAKHVEIDRTFTADYSQTIKDLFAFAFSMPEDYSSGRVRADDVMTMQLMLGNAVDGSLSAILESMIRQRNDAQLAVDNVQEYIRIAQACPDQGIVQAVPTPLPATAPSPR